MKKGRKASPPAKAPRRLGAASAWMFVASMLTNLAMVLYHRAMSDRLGNAYADLSVLTALGNVLAVINLGVSTWMVKVFATDESHGGDGAAKARLKALSLPFLGAVLGLCLALLPFSAWIGAYLHTPAPVFAWVLAGFAGGMLAALLRSTVQGLHRFGWLGSSLVADGASRVGFAIGLANAGWGVNGALASQVGAQAVGCAVAYGGVAGIEATHTEGTPEKPRYWDMFLDTATLGLFSLLCFLDVMVVKHHVDEVQAGLYSRAALVAKSFLYLASAMSMVLLPAVASARAAKRDPRPILLRLVGAALGIELLGLGALWVMTGLAIRLLCGVDPAYQALDALVRELSMAMIPLALLQMLLYYLLALGDRLPLLFLGIAVPAFWLWLEAAQGQPAQVPLRLGTVAMALLVACGFSALRRKA